MALLPLFVGLLAAGHLGAAFVGLKDSLLPDSEVFFSLERQYVRVPPGHRMGADARPVEARSDAVAVGGYPLRTPVDNALCAEAGRSCNSFGLAFRVVWRVQCRIEDLQPTRKWLVPTSRYNQEVAGAGC